MSIANPTAVERQDQKDRMAFEQIQNARKRQAAAAELVKAFFDARDPDTEDAHAAFLALVEPYILKRVMDDCRGNISRASRRLGLNRSTTRKQLKQYGMY